MTKTQKVFAFSALVAALSGCAASPHSQQPSEPQQSTVSSDNWVARSDAIAEAFTRSFSALTPETGSALGYREYDKLGSNPTRESDTQELELLKQWQARLQTKLSGAKSQNMIVDLQILLEQVNSDLKERQVRDQLGAISFNKASKFVYSSLFNLINEQSPEQRKQDAVSRFIYYMSDDGKTTLIDAFGKGIDWDLAKYQGRDPFFPFVGEVNKYLDNSPTYVEGVKQLLEQSGRDDWHDAFARFKSEVARYDDIVRQKILPHTRRSPNLPRALYQLKLKQIGVDATPEQLIADGQRDYKRIYRQFSAMAKKVAAKHQLEKDDPASVVAFLKARQVATTEQVSKLYNGAADRLTEIIRDNDIVSLPRKKLKIRFAGDAESKAAPVPHLNPPPLIDNNGVVPEFVVPTSSSGQMPFDDFSYADAAIILTAHEGRPGHDLQFSKMIEHPVSIVRARYAMNSVNVEGWALWSEDLVYPYLTDEQKLIAIQTRLWRVARYFLDPMVQLGLADQAKVVEVFHNELGVSKVMAGLEYQRYAFRLPGQATSYYRGLLNIQGLKQELSDEFGPLKLRCFNDTLLSFGLLPHSQIRLFKQDFKPCAK